MGGSSEKKNLSGEQRLGEFLGKNRKALVCFLLVVVAAIVAYAVFFNVSTSIVKKNLDKIERIEYSLTKDAAALDAATARVDAAIAKTAVDIDEFEAAKAQFYTIYDKVAGTSHAEKEISFFGKVVLWLEKVVNKTTGQKGYSDALRFWEK